jgi:choline dehydrogenase
MDTFDYIIIGAGSAGCVLANRLSEDPAVTVCVLEAGPRDWHPFIHLPAGFIKTFYDRSVNWCYDQEPGPHINNRVIYAPRGKTLGGSSSINGHVYNRGQSHDFDTWAQAGNRGWGYADVLPYFRRMERRLADADDADPTYRGRDGELVVSDAVFRHPLCDAFIAGCIEHGIPFNPDYNGAKQEGVNYTQRTVHRGLRVSAAKAFLHPIRHRPNLDVRTHAHVLAITTEGKRATGVRLVRRDRGEQEQTVSARREVILSGGAYNSPQLLQLSGIGDPALLAEHGIPLVHALPSVGVGLQDHYAPRFNARVKNIETVNEMVRGWRLGREVARWAVQRKGVLTAAPTMVYGFWHSGETAGSSDLQFTFTPASYKEGVQGQLENEPGMTVAIWQQRPESRGYVKIRSADPFAPPLIQSNYLADDLDRRVCLAGVKLGRKLLRSRPLEPYFDRETYPGDQVQSDADLMAVARERGTTTFHPASTCRMGPASDPASTVDDHLRVHGMQGLRVVDASIMPRMISANLNAATLMIADRASDLIRGRAPLEAALLPGR